MAYRVYCYTNQITNQKYIGCTSLKYQSQRAGKNGHGYSQNTPFGQAIQQYGWNSFVYSVLEDNLSEKQIDSREKFWIEKLNTLFPNGYNLQSGGLTNYVEHSITTERKHNRVLTKEWKRHISESSLHLSGNKNGMYGKTGEQHPFYGKHHTESARKLMSEKHYDCSGENNSMYGRTGENNPNYGKHWYNNGIINTFAHECPEGWSKGKLSFKNKII